MGPVVESVPQQPEAPAAGTRIEAEEKKLPATAAEGIPEREAEQAEKLPAAPVEADRQLEPAAEVAVEESATVDSASQSQPPRQEIAVVAEETAQPAAAIEEAPVVPQTIKAREVIKHREELVPAIPETIASQRVKILKQEEEPDPVEMPTTPTTIRAVEQKKESVVEPVPAPLTEQSPQAVEPEKVAITVPEKPKKTDKEEFLEEARDRLQLSIDNERENREKALDDLGFLSGEDQWDADLRKEREDQGKPCLTINRLPQFVRQVTGQIRQMNPAIRVVPADNMATEDVAEIFAGLILVPMILPALRPARGGLRAGPSIPLAILFSTYLI